MTLNGCRSYSSAQNKYVWWSELQNNKIQLLVKHKMFFFIILGKIESEKCSHSHSEMILRIMDEVRKQIGLTFNEDS